MTGMGVTAASYAVPPKSQRRSMKILTTRDAALKLAALPTEEQTAGRYRACPAVSDPASLLIKKKERAAPSRRECPHIQEQRRLNMIALRRLLFTLAPFASAPARAD